MWSSWVQFMCAFKIQSILLNRFTVEESLRELKRKFMNLLWHWWRCTGYWRYLAPCDFVWVDVIELTGTVGRVARRKISRELTNKLLSCWVLKAEFSLSSSSPLSLSAPPSYPLPPCPPTLAPRTESDRNDPTYQSLNISNSGMLKYTWLLF